jgi:regulator of RNase E activity RraA
MTAPSNADAPARHLDVNDLERVERFRVAGYGGSVSDALDSVGVRGTMFSDAFTPLTPGNLLVGRAITVKIHTQVGGMEAVGSADDDRANHPQRRMMQAVADAEDGSVLCFDCGGDKQPAHFGEMSCQLAYAHGCRGLLLAGQCRDTRYVAAMDDFAVYCFGTRPNYYGGWSITEVNQPIYLPGHLTHYVQVTPGDFVFADGDGAQLIPSDLVDEVLLRVETTFANENAERDQIAAGMSIDEVYRTYGVL